MFNFSFSFFGFSHLPKRLAVPHEVSWWIQTLEHGPFNTEILLITILDVSNQIPNNISFNLHPPWSNHWIFHKALGMFCCAYESVVFWIRIWCETASSSRLIRFHLYFLRSLFHFPCVDVIIKFTVISFSFRVLSFFSWPSFVLCFSPPPTLGLHILHRLTITIWWCHVLVLSGSSRCLRFGWSHFLA